MYLTNINLVYVSLMIEQYHLGTTKDCQILLKLFSSSPLITPSLFMSDYLSKCNPNAVKIS